MEDFFNNPIDEKSVCYPRGSFQAANEPSGRVALIGHSAGGWISRLYLNLSGRRYNGKVFHGHKLVHSLVTLGSPHMEGAFSQAFRPTARLLTQVIIMEFDILLLLARVTRAHLLDCLHRVHMPSVVQTEVMEATTMEMVSLRLRVR